MAVLMDDLVSIGKVAVFLDVSRATVKRMCEEGVLESCRVGKQKQIRVFRSSLARYIGKPDVNDALRMALEEAKRDG